MKNIDLLVLKSKICGLEHSSKKFRKLIQESKGNKRWQLRYDKNQLGGHTRLHVIAYALLRGIPYEKIEIRCAKGNEAFWHADQIVKIIHDHIKPWETKNWSKQRVLDLLKRGDVK